MTWLVPARGRPTKLHCVMPDGGAICGITPKHGWSADRARLTSKYCQACVNARRYLVREEKR